MPPFTEFEENITLEQERTKELRDSVRVSDDIPQIQRETLLYLLNRSDLEAKLHLRSIETIKGYTAQMTSVQALLHNMNTRMDVRLTAIEGEMAERVEPLETTIKQHSEWLDEAKSQIKYFLLGVATLAGILAATNIKVLQSGSDSSPPQPIVNITK